MSTSHERAHPIEVAWRRFLVRDDSKLLLSDRTAPRTGASMTRWRSEVNSNRRYRFLNFQTTTSCYNLRRRRVALIVRNTNVGSALLSQRSRESFSGMRHTATDSAAGFQREAAPFWLRRFQQQKLKGARNAERGINASQPVSIAKPSMMLSYDRLETGTGSSNSLRSTNESLRTDTGSIARDRG